MPFSIKNDNIYEELKNYIDGLKIIDTHEHLPAFESMRAPTSDVLMEYLRQYFTVDLITAGLPRSEFAKIHAKDLSIGEKWSIVAPYWNIARNTGYGQALDISAKALYDVKRIDGSTIEELNSKFLEARQKGGMFRKILKELCNTETCVLDDLAKPGGIEADKEFFTTVCRINPWIELGNHTGIEYLEDLSGARIAGFSDLLDACKAYLQNIYDAGCRVYKLAVAYSRSLKFMRRTYAEAEAAFNKIYSSGRGHDVNQTCGDERRNYEDYMLHYIFSFANKNNMTIQIHTGIQEGNGNILTHSNPALLENLFPEYPYVWFDIFHISYPYHHIIGTYSKMYPNVFIDMCWAHTISPSASMSILYEWLDLLPLNKVNAFGGDYAFIDAVYGHLELARRNVAHVLAAKVRCDDFDMDTAKMAAQMLFYLNPKRILQIK